MAGALMRGHDWSQTTLGHPAQWPEALKTLTSLMLRSKTPVFVAWGPELCLLYNDAYMKILGQRHPAALGRGLYAVWPEVRADIEPLVNQTLAGESVYLESASFILRRNGADERASFSFSYTPVDGPDGQAAGFYCALAETTARELAEKTRQTETQWLYSMFEQAPGFMAVVREPGHVYELANSAYLRLVGRDDVVGKSFRDIGRKVEGQDYGALLDEVYATGKPFIGTRMPVAFLRQCDGEGKGEKRLLNFIFQPITRPDGAVSGVFIEGHDVTELAQAEVELRESRHGALQSAQILEALLQAAPVGIILTSADGTLLRVNPAYRKIWGNYPLHRKAGDFVEWKAWWADNSERHGRRLEPREWALARALRGEEEAPRDTLEIEPFGQPGVRRTVLNCGAPVRDMQGHIIGSVIAQMDITDQVKNEAVLRETVLKYQTMANAIPLMIWSTQPDGHHDYYNQQWYDYTGVSRGAAHGQGWKKLFHPDDLPLAVKNWRHSLATGEPYEVEYRLRHQSGQYRWILTRARPVLDEQGVINRWMGSCTDIHEQKEAQEELLQADRLKNEFLAMLAHELRNPLAPIVTAADLLSRRTLDATGVLQLSEVISRQARHMTRLIDDLLDVSRVTRGQVTLDKKSVELEGIIAEAVEQVRPLLEFKGHCLELQLDPRSAQVSGDRLRLVQVIGNVLNNAIKYTPNGGSIALQTLVYDEQVKIGVRDNGIGMSGDLIRIAFDLFTQGERTSDRTQGGLGIGLALVRSLVHLHGGTVSVHSAGMGLGSELNITLPRLPPASRPAGPLAGEGGAAPEGKALRVMVVDDNIDAARLLGMFVELLGHEAFVQFHPADALECAAQVKPDICLLDIGLPDMDGYALARRLRQLPGMQGTVMAAVTGYSQRKDKQAAYAAGFNFHFAKPVDAHELETWLAGVTAQVSGHETPAGAAA